jgi:hypothetical protein
MVVDFAAVDGGFSLRDEFGAQHAVAVPGRAVVDGDLETCITAAVRGILVGGA